MRITLCHNRYGSQEPSGENQVVAAEEALLTSHGHRVSEFVRESDALRARGAVGKLVGAASTPWNPFAARALAAFLRERDSEVLHVHNTFPRISAAIFHRVPAPIPRVLTLHNYRLFCAAAIPLRDGRICIDCIERRSALPAVAHGCYRDSRVASVPLALGIELHRMVGTWTRHVDAFIALTEFQRRLMIEGGLPPDLVHVKPNVCAPPPAGPDWAARDRGAVFVGRLSAEKGVDTLLSAWRSLHDRLGEGTPALTIIGDGPEREGLQAMADGLEDSVSFTGRLDERATRALIARSRLLVVPSRWFEGFPMVIAEAFASGTPVLASDVGALATIVEEGGNGRLFPLEDAAHLAATVIELFAAPRALERLHEGALRDYEARYSERGNHERLMAVYSAAAEVRRVRDG